MFCGKMEKSLLQIYKNLKNCVERLKHLRHFSARYMFEKNCILGGRSENRSYPFHTNSNTRTRQESLTQLSAV